MESDDTRQYSLAELKARHAKRQPIAAPEATPYKLDDDLWASARVVMPPPGKASVNLRLDTDVLAWFRQQGKGHLTRMNPVLRSFMDAHR